MEDPHIRGLWFCHLKLFKTTFSAFVNFLLLLHMVIVGPSFSLRQL